MRELIERTPNGGHRPWNRLELWLLQRHTETGDPRYQDAATVSHQQSAALLSLAERKPAFVTDYQRMWDLVRQQRSELLDAGLITREEYATLASEETKDKPGQGSPSPRRLESYDDLQRKFLSLAEERETGWQPIATAPKDTPVLIAWAGKDWAPQTAWLGVASWTDEEGASYRTPTHWMPLPKPPASLTPTEGQ